MSLQLTISNGYAQILRPTKPPDIFMILFDLETMSAQEMSNAPGDYVNKRKLPNLFSICAFLPQGTVIQLSDISSLYQEWDFHSHHQITC